MVDVDDGPVTCGVFRQVRADVAETLVVAASAVKAKVAARRVLQDAEAIGPKDMRTNGVQNPPDVRVGAGRCAPAVQEVVEQGVATRDAAQVVDQEEVAHPQRPVVVEHRQRPLLELPGNRLP